MSLLNVNTIEPSTGTDITLGASGDTITVPSGATFTVSGTATGLVNTPAFMVVMGSDDSISTGSWTKATFDTEIFDTDSAFSSNKFTVPSGGAGKYALFGHVYFTSIDDGNKVEARIYKNGSNAGGTSTGSSTLRWYSGGSNQEMDAGWTWVGTLAESDYIELYVLQNNGDTQTLYRETWLAGYRLSGV